MLRDCTEFSSTTSTHGPDPISYCSTSGRRACSPVAAEVVNRPPHCRIEAPAASGRLRNPDPVQVLDESTQEVMELGELVDRQADRPGHLVGDVGHVLS